MTDEAARKAEREAAWGEVGGALHLTQRLRRGTLTPERLKLAAFAGDAAALAAFACKHDDIRDGDRGCVCWYANPEAGANAGHWVNCLVGVFGGVATDRSFVSKGFVSTGAVDAFVSPDGLADRTHPGTVLGARACLAVCEAVWAKEYEPLMRGTAFWHAPAQNVLHAIDALRCYVREPTSALAKVYEARAGVVGARQRWITSPAHALVGPVGWSYFSDAVDDAERRLIGHVAARTAMNKAVAAWALA